MENTFKIIMCVDAYFGISKNGDLPWRSTPIGMADLRHFKEKTLNSTIIMGRKTWESLQGALPDRINMVVSRSPVEGADFTFNSLSEAINHGYFFGKPVFVIGGAQLCKEAFQREDIGEVILTTIPNYFRCDTFLEIPREFGVVDSFDLNFGIYSFKNCGIVLKKNQGNVYKINNRCGEEEHKYHSLILRILREPVRDNRTAVKTKAAFSKTLKFYLSREQKRVLPALTSKFVALKSVIVELLWFLRGDTDTDYLKKYSVNIWDGNTSRAYLDFIGHSDKPVGWVGRAYPAQWRNWGKSGVDQIAKVIETLKTNPMDRRMLVSSWNPEELSQVALPPCHYSFQFYVNSSKELCCQVNMRSADVGLGVPFNIASYAILTHIVSMITGISPGVLSIVMTDCHVYVNHEEELRKQCNRDIVEFPTLEMKGSVDITELNINDFGRTIHCEDFVVENYEPRDPVKCEMAV